MTLSGCRPWSHILFSVLPTLFLLTCATVLSRLESIQQWPLNELKYGKIDAFSVLTVFCERRAEWWTCRKTYWCGCVSVMLEMYVGNCRTNLGRLMIMRALQWRVESTSVLRRWRRSIATSQRWSRFVKNWTTKIDCGVTWISSGTVYAELIGSFIPCFVGDWTNLLLLLFKCVF